MNDICIIVPVYKPGAMEQKALSQLIKVTQGLNVISEIVLVNDSDSKLPFEYIKIVNGSHLCRVVSCGKNYGRSYARNLGAQSTTAPVLWFLDADCFVFNETLDVLLKHNLEKSNVIQGMVINNQSDGFWHKYQQQRRNTQLKSSVIRGSTANFVIKRTLFETIGGFDSSYRWYGFEDRDLLARLPQNSTIIFEQKFVVEHNGNIDLATLRNKMSQSALSGRIFQQKFPLLYPTTPYFQFDSRNMGPIKRQLLTILAKVEELSQGTLNFLIESKWVPFYLKKWIVLYVSAMAYFRGSNLKQRSL